MIDTGITNKYNLNYLNSVLANVPISYVLKTPENL